ncbi:MAG: mannose-6-phosphate isomerase, partial [Luteolibacter sp.]
MIQSNYDKYPQVEVSGMDDQCWNGWANVMRVLSARCDAKVIVIECYVGVLIEEIASAVSEHIPSAIVFGSQDAFRDSGEIERMLEPFLGNGDPIFGCISTLQMEDFLCSKKLAALRAEIAVIKDGLVVVIGPGASIVHRGDVLVYAEMPRWEAQGRMRRNEMSNLGTRNRETKWSLQYKRAFFNDWPVCDRLKLGLKNVDFILDTCKR